MEDETIDPAGQQPANPVTDQSTTDAGADAGTKALINQWIDKIQESKKFHAETFKQMRKNMKFARFGSDEEWHKSGKYTVPILARHINQSVAQLYARNPKALATRRPRMLFKLWDGRQDSLDAAMGEAEQFMVMQQQAMQVNPMMAQTMQPPQTALAIIQEIQQAQQTNLMLDRMARTLTLLWEYYINEQGASYKMQLKSLVRRAKVCKVGWIKLGYQRILQPRPDVTGQINDITSKIANIEAELAKIQKDGDGYEKDSGRAKQLQLNLADLERDKMMVVREGPVLSFPRADQIIVDKMCFHLKSLSGAGFVAEEFEKTPCEILKEFKVDIKTDFKQYAADGNPYDKDPKDCTARVYEIWDQENLQTAVICEGYPNWLREPATPENWLERFWPYFPLVFNEIEDKHNIYPQSDVEHGQHIQSEYNRTREALRQHRIAARPYYVTAKGLDRDEKDRLANHADHEVIEMPTLSANQKVEDLIQRGPVANIDPNLYETETQFNDLLRSVGTQESQLGGVSNSTATESSIAEQSMSTSKSDQTDDLDEVLSEVFRAGGQLMLLNVPKETVIEIVGPGAVWPDAPESREEVAKEIYLDMEAGSSGRPNQAADLAKLERAMPYLQNLPGLNPAPIIRRYADLLDIDPEEMMAEGMPSMTAINAMMAKMAMGPTGGDPAAEGTAGATNAPTTQPNEPGPQPAYPTGQPGQ